MLPVRRKCRRLLKSHPAIVKSVLNRRLGTTEQKRGPRRRRHNAVLAIEFIGRCVNVTLLEHQNSLPKKSTNLAKYCFGRGCTLFFVDTGILFVHKDAVLEKWWKPFTFQGKEPIVLVSLL